MPEPLRFTYDVFVSYSRPDVAWVTHTLLPKLESAGLKTCVDFRHFNAARTPQANVQDAVRSSQRTLLVITPEWFASERTVFEGALAGQPSLAGFLERVIPVMRKACEFPPEARLLTGLSSIDFTRPDRQDAAWRQLLTALGKPAVETITFVPSRFGRPLTTAPPAGVQLATTQVKPAEPKPAVESQRNGWLLTSPYPMQSNFTGRLEERTMLTQWIESDAAHPLLVLRALGGFGKSSLTWHWLTHDVKPTFWPRVIWWSFYEGEASFENFLAEAMFYFNSGKAKPDKVSSNEVKQLLELLLEPGILIILDGFERVLRAFSGLDAAYQGDGVAETQGTRSGDPQSATAPKAGENAPAASPGNADSNSENTPGVKPPPQRPPVSSAPEGDACHHYYNSRNCHSPLAEDFLREVATTPQLRSKVLLTTRLCPRVLDARGGGYLSGCLEEELKQMQPVDIVDFFHAQGIRGTPAQIAQACEPYGGHPLSLRLLTGLIAVDVQQPGDIAAARRLDANGDPALGQNLAVQMACESITPAQQVLMARIACFRSPAKHTALQSLIRAEERDPDAVSPAAGSPAPTLDTCLRDLVSRGLLHHDPNENRFDLHPIVRRCVYDRLDVINGELILRRKHALQADYDSLPPERQSLLGLIACFHSPVKYNALKLLTKPGAPSPGAPASPLTALDRNLRELVACGLLRHEPKDNRFDLHPIVRRCTRDRLDAINGDLVQRLNHVLQAACNSLTPDRQVLLGLLACFRSPVKHDVLLALAKAGQSRREEAIASGKPPKSPFNTAPLGATLDADLRDLITRGLLFYEPKHGRLDLHPTVRRHAYDRLHSFDRAVAHGRLREYSATVPMLDKVGRMEDLVPVVELYHHIVRSGQYEEAFTFFMDRINHATYHQLGAYLLRIDLLRALFPDGEDRLPRLKDESDQAWVMAALANSYSLSGQPRQAVPIFEQANTLASKLDNKRNLAVGLGNLANRHRDLGALRAAESSVRQRISLCKDTKDEQSEAVGHQELGRLLACRGAYAEAESKLETALTLFKSQKSLQFQGITCAYSAMRELLQSRSASDTLAPPGPPPITLARRALELAEEHGRAEGPVERDFIRAYWLLGTAHRLAEKMDEAGRNLQEALQRCRRINAVEHEADILIELARLRASTGAADAACKLADEALLITERSGYVLQGADAHLELARQALNLSSAAPDFLGGAVRQFRQLFAGKQNDLPKKLAEAVQRATPDQKKHAREHAREALRLATCDGPPDYTYHAACTEANAILKLLP